MADGRRGGVAVESRTSSAPFPGSHPFFKFSPGMYIGCTAHQVDGINSYGVLRVSSMHGHASLPGRLLRSMYRVGKSKMTTEYRIRGRHQSGAAVSPWPDDCAGGHAAVLCGCCCCFTSLLLLMSLKRGIPAGLFQSTELLAGAAGWLSEMRLCAAWFLFSLFASPTLQADGPTPSQMAAGTLRLPHETGGRPVEPGWLAGRLVSASVCVCLS